MSPISQSIFNLTTICGLIIFSLSSNVVQAQGLPLEVEEIQKSIETHYKVSFPKQKLMVKESASQKDKATSEKDISKNEAPVKKKEVVKTKEGPKLSKKLQDQLERNREILRKRQKDYWNQAKASKASEDKKESDWMRRKTLDQEAWTKTKKEEVQTWVNYKKEQLNKWRQERKGFLKEVPILKKDLTDIRMIGFGSSSPTLKIEDQTLEKYSQRVAANFENSLDLSILSEAFLLPVKSQGRRPTCAAFSAVRALEIVLAKKTKSSIDLSEQYFYFASKPDCQKSPCNRPGSWPAPALEKSKKNASFDIPLERDCPYQDTKVIQNDTQIPLASSCFKGSAKVADYYRVRSREEVQNAIKKGMPIIAGFKLTDDFFNNEGFVFYGKSAKIGSGLHAQGHALLLIGVMELPKELHATQGQYCTLVANSWGLGWGKGGHACLSDKWFDSYRYDMDFIAIGDALLKS